MQLEAGISQVQITIIFFGVALIALLTPKQVLVQLVHKGVVSDLLINKCFVLSYLLVLKYILFLHQKKKVFTSSISASSDSFPSKFLSVPRPFLRLSFIKNRNETKLDT